MNKEPNSPAEWQGAVDVAYVMLLIDSAKLYGLVSGGPEVNVERAQDIIRRGEELGVVPSPNAVNYWIRG